MVSRSLLVLSGGYFLMFFAAGLQQLLIPFLQQSTGRSAAQCSWILGSVYFSAVLWRVFASFTIARLGFYWSVVLGFIPYLTFPLALRFTDNYWLLLLAAFIWGWGAAAIWIAGPTSLLAATHPDRYGRASGVFYACVHGGQALGVVLLNKIHNQWGWNAWLWTAFALYLAGEIVILFLPRNNQGVTSPSLGAVVGMYRHTRLVVLAAMLIVSSVGFGLTLSAMTGHVERSFAQGLGIVGYVTLGFYLGRLVCSLIGGWCCDRFGRAPVMTAGFAFGALGLIAASLVTHPAVLFLASFALGGVVGLVPVSATAIIGDSVAPDQRHLAFGSVYLWSNLGVGLVIVFSQYLARAFGNFRVCFAVFAGLYALCAIVMRRFSIAKLEAGVTLAATKG